MEKAEHRREFLQTLRVFCFLSLLSLGAFAPLPQTQAVTSTQTRYMGAGSNWSWDGIQNIFPMFTWKQEASYDYCNQTLLSTNRYFQYGIRVYKIDINGTETQITIGVSAVVQRNNGEIAEGYQYGFWNATETNMTRSDTLEVKYYQRYSITYPTIWALWATQLSIINLAPLTWYGDGLGAIKLAASTWNVTYYTFRGNTGKSFGVYFGDTYEMQINNIKIETGGKTPAWILSGVVIAAMVIIPFAIIGLFLLKKKH